MFYKCNNFNGSCTKDKNVQCKRSSFLKYKVWWQLGHKWSHPPSCFHVTSTAPVFHKWVPVHGTGPRILPEQRCGLPRLIRGASDERRRTQGTGAKPDRGCLESDWLSLHVRVCWIPLCFETHEAEWIAESKTIRRLKMAIKLVSGARRMRYIVPNHPDGPAPHAFLLLVGPSPKPAFCVALVWLFHAATL